MERIDGDSGKAGPAGTAIPVVVGGENAAGGLAGLSGQAVRRLVEGGADVLLYGLGVASRMQPGKLEIE